MIPLAQVLAWKFGDAYRLAGTSTLENQATGEMELIDWNAIASSVPRPTPAAIQSIIAEWQAAGTPEDAKSPDERALDKLSASRELRVMVRAVAALTGKTIAECRAAILAAIKAET